MSNSALFLSSAHYPQQMKCWEDAKHIQENYNCNLDYVEDNQIANGFELVELVPDIL